ncbi:MAG: Ni,Fe-hydrogenase I large subunit, partial [bacterium]|nr:Ni,Fe-hydrogenase I large subunit [bacterium]
ELVMIPGRLSGNLDSFPSTQMIEEDGLEREGFGLAQVEAARGRLVHLAQVDQGIVRAYTILAPTEWNFHPQGVAARALTRIGKDSDDGARFRAGMLVKAIDPCVAFKVRLH